MKRARVFGGKKRIHVGGPDYYTKSGGNGYGSLQKK